MKKQWASPSMHKEMRVHLQSHAYKGDMVSCIYVSDGF
jgi:hypothetical protein